MKKNKAFTLVELLAVIIIIGLLVVLIIPKVNSTIKDSRKSAGELSANALVRESYNFYLTERGNGSSFEECTYDFSNNINTCSGFEFSGKKPKTGTINIKTNGEVAFAVQFGNYCYIKNYNSDDITTISYDEETCVYIEEKETKKAFEIVKQEGEELSTGDEVVLKSEHFYVVKVNNDKVILITKYNLYIGNECTTYESSTCTPIESSTGLQNEIAKGWEDDNKPRIGVIAFAKYNTSVYNENSNLYEYVEEYVAKLKEMSNKKNIDITGRILSLEEAEELGCNRNSKSCSSTAQSWVHETTYWLDSVNETNCAWFIYTNGPFFNYCYYGNDYGIRPVIIINKSDIEGVSDN